MMPQRLIYILLLWSATLHAQDGVLDLTFGTDGYVFTEETDECFDAVIQPDGKIILAGTSSYHNLAVLRYTENGEPDTTFNHSGSLVIDFEDRIDVYAVALQEDGRMILGGSADFYDDEQPFLCRLFANGAIDSSFGTDGFSFFHFTPDYAYDEYIADIQLQPDGKIVFCGSTNPYYDGLTEPAFTIGRANNNGMIDSLFGVNGMVTNSFAGQENYVNALILQPDGKIIAGGVSDTYFGLVRYHSDGFIDSTFGANGKVLTEIEEYAVIRQLALQPDGKIVAMGYYGSYNMDIAVVRYDANGIIDNSFGTDGIFKDDIINGDDEKYGLLILPDNTILVASHRKVGWEDASLFYITRLTAAGQTDTSFAEEGILTIAPNDGHNYPRALLYQGDGKVIIAGYSTTYDPLEEKFCALRILVEIDSLITEIPPAETQDIHLYVSDNIIHINSGDILPYEIALYDMTGRLLMTEHIAVNEWAFPLHGLPPGIYVTVITAGQKQFMQKIAAGG